MGRSATVLTPDLAQLRERGERTRRLFDLTAAVSLLLLSSPVLFVVGALVKITSPGRVLFQQVRLGRNGAPFLLLKFRTMDADAEAMLERDPILRATYLAGGHKIPEDEDPRVTPFGRYLRRTSLDELPQLVNVLRGDMNLVGPRPIVPSEVERYPGFLELMRVIPPGLTGLWQVSGEPSANYVRRAELDSQYAAQRSFTTDLRILVQTVLRLAR